MDLTGRRVLLTGASSGIGAAAARSLDAHGARVALLARSVAPLQALSDQLTRAHVAVADVTDADAVDAAVASAAEGLGGLDGLVNSAGVAVPGGVRDGDPAGWRAMFDVNVLGLLTVTRAALPHLCAAPLADIVNISSMSGRRVASPELGIYAGSKHAVHAISEGLAGELADTAVRTTVISPGYVATPIFEGVDGAQRHREWAATLGLDVAAVAAQIAGVFGQPSGVRMVEVAMVSTRQG